MYYLILVSKAQSGCHLFGYADSLFIVQPSFFFNDLAKALAVYEFHHYKMNIAFLAYVINVYNIRMRKTCCSLRFLPEIFDKFFERSRGKIGIFISHRLNAAKMADKIIVLNEGEIVGIGNHEELLENCSTYQMLYQAEIYESEAPTNNE